MCLFSRQDDEVEHVAKETTGANGRQSVTIEIEVDALVHLLVSGRVHFRLRAGQQRRVLLATHSALQQEAQKCQIGQSREETQNNIIINRPWLGQIREATFG